MFVTFLLSAAVHELVMAVVTQKIRYVYLASAPLLQLYMDIWTDRRIFVLHPIWYL